MGMHASVRLATSELELPSDPAQLPALLSLIEGDELVLYASGASGSGPAAHALLDVMTDEARERVAYRNGRSWFAAGSAVARG